MVIATYATCTWVAGIHLPLLDGTIWLTTGGICLSAEGHVEHAVGLCPMQVVMLPENFGASDSR